MIKKIFALKCKVWDKTLFGINRFDIREGYFKNLSINTVVSNDI